MGGGPLIPPEETLFFPVTHFRFREHNGSEIIIQTLGVEEGLAFLTSCIRFGGAAGGRKRESGRRGLAAEALKFLQWKCDCGLFFWVKEEEEERKGGVVFTKASTLLQNSFRY